MTFVVELWLKKNAGYMMSNVLLITCHGCVQTGRMKGPSAELTEAKVNLKTQTTQNRQL